MKLNEKWGWLLAFTVVFAVLAGFVFWGTWSPDFAPVMPDNATTHSPFWFAGWWRGLLRSGLFVPGDLMTLVGGPYVWQELKYVVSLYCAALGLAYFCRGRGLSRLASYGAGLLLAFSGYWMTLFSAGHYGWFQWMTYGIFAFGLVDRAMRQNRLVHWLLLGACVAWGSFYQPDMWLLFTVFTGVYALCLLIGLRTFPWKGILLSLATFALIAAPSVRNAFVNSLAEREKQIAEGQTVGGAAAKTGDKKSDETEKRWIFVTNWSLPAEETAEFFSRRLNGDTSCPFTLSIGMKDGNGIRPYKGALGRPKDAKEGNYRQHSLYVGIVTSLLALVGLVFGVRGLFNRTIEQSNNRTILFFAVAAIVFWLFSLGRNCEPVYRLVYQLPFGDYLRAPVKWHHLTELCLAVLAAYGIDALVKIRISNLKSQIVAGVVGAVVLAGAIDLASVAKLYCAPYSVERARRTGETMQMTVMPRQQLQNPQVAAMARAGKIVTLSSYLGHPDYLVVGILNRCERPKPLEKGDVSTGIVILGILSLLTTLGVAIYGISIAVRPRNVV